jgi:GxxExxY protein
VDEGEIGSRILDCSTKVHKALGPGLLESAYEACLAFELDQLGLAYQRQLALRLVYQTVKIDAGYRIDLLVERKVVVEIKSVEQLTDVHRAQLLSYLRLGGFRLG